MTDPDGVHTEMTHDRAGNRLTVTTAGRTWKYGYDRNNNKVSFTEPLPTRSAAADYTHTRTFDDIGRVTSTTPAVRDLTESERADFWIGTTDYHYDAAHPSISSTSEAALYQVGQLSYTTGPGKTVKNTYDRFGHPAQNQETLPDLAGAPAHTLVATASRHPGGNLQSIRYTAVSDTYTPFTGKRIEYFYDDEGVERLLRFDIATDKIMSIAQDRDDSGVVTDRTTNVNFTSGYAQIKTKFAHDKYGRLTNQRTMQGETQRYQQTTAYWDSGQIRSVQEQLGGTAAPTTTFYYNYDHRQQLSSAMQMNGYDGAFSYTPGGRMASASVAHYGADAERVPTRNVQHVYQDAATPGGDPQRLAALRKWDGTTVASYEYDELGNTTSRTLPDGTTVAQRWDGPRLRKVSKTNGESETYYYDGPTRIAAVRYHTDGTIAETRRWFGDLEISYTPGQQTIYRQQISLGGETIGRIDHEGGAPTLEHYVTTQQGHQVMALKATDGSPQRSTSYGPFGEVLSDDRTQDKYTREFNGKEYDETGGLHYYGYRYYDPLALQWTSADPLFRVVPDAQLGNPRAANLYTFSGNNPVSNVDPNGLCATCGFEGMADAVFAAYGWGSPSKQVKDEFAGGMAKAAVAGYTEGMLRVTPGVNTVYAIATAEDGTDLAIAVGFALLGTVTGVRAPKVPKVKVKAPKPPAWEKNVDDAFDEAWDASRARPVSDSDKAFRRTADQIDADAQTFGFDAVARSGLTPAERQLVRDTLNADQVAVGRSKDINVSGMFTLDNWFMARRMAWSPRLQKVYNYALFQRGKAGKPVHFISGGQYSGTEAAAAEAGARLSGGRNTLLWPECMSC